MGSYSKLLWALLGDGSLKKQSYDYNHARREALSVLRQYVPAHHKLNADTSDPHYASSFRSIISDLLKTRGESGGHILNEQLNLAYIRIPKAASTSAGSAMLQSIYPDLAHTLLNSTQWNYLIDANVSTTISKGCKYFALVRNPYARIVSVYRDFFERSTDPFMYQDYFAGLFQKDMSFEEFVQRVHMIPDRLKDQHIKPQYRFLKYYKERNLTLTVHKVEDEESLSQFLKEFNLVLPSLNTSSDYNYASYYSSDILKLVSEIYAHDIRIFGYANYKPSNQSFER